MAFYDCVGKKTKGTTSKFTILVEGAKEDIITIYDTSGNVVDNVIFDTDETSKIIEYATRPDVTELVFESSVAKGLNGSGNFSKTISLPSEDINEMYAKVMPDGALYWYGNECKGLTGGWTGGKYIRDYGERIGTYEKRTNSLYTYNVGLYSCGFFTDNMLNMSAFTKLNNIYQSSNDSNPKRLAYGGYKPYNAVDGSGSYVNVPAATTPTRYTWNINVKDAYYISVGSYYNVTYEVFAVWFE